MAASTLRFNHSHSRYREALSTPESLEPLTPITSSPYRSSLSFATTRASLYLSGYLRGRSVQAGP